MTDPVQVKESGEEEKAIFLGEKRNFAAATRGHRNFRFLLQTAILLRAKFGCKVPGTSSLFYKCSMSLDFNLVLDDDPDRQNSSKKTPKRTQHLVQLLATHDLHECADATTLTQMTWHKLRTTLLACFIIMYFRL